MPPKTPKQLRDQIKKQNAKKPPAAGHSRTAEGLEIRNPKRDDLFSNLEKAIKPGE